MEIKELVFKNHLSSKAKIIYLIIFFEPPRILRYNKIAITLGINVDTVKRGIKELQLMQYIKLIAPSDRKRIENSYKLLVEIKD